MSDEIRHGTWIEPFAYKRSASGAVDWIIGTFQPDAGDVEKIIVLSMQHATDPIVDHLARTRFAGYLRGAGYAPTDLNPDAVDDWRLALHRLFDPSSGVYLVRDLESSFPGVREKLVGRRTWMRSRTMQTKRIDPKTNKPMEWRDHQALTPDEAMLQTNIHPPA